jgi:transposase
VSPLLRGGEVHDIQQLKRQGLSVTAISTLTGFDRKTVRKYLTEAEAVPTYGPRPPRSTLLDPYRPYVEERLQAGVWNAVVLLRELKERGYPGGYTMLKDYLRPRRRAAREVATRRFETPPGYQAQIDWGDLGRVSGPQQQRQPLYGFVCTLGHSRALFADVATDQRLGTLLSMHEAAFEALGGVPQELLYDRMKTVALGVDERGEIDWQPLFLDFARYWGFTPRLCRAYRPQTKGKVESGIRYVRANFLCGREAFDVPDLRQQLGVWTAEVANRRVHGTTHRCILDAWEAERARLQPRAGRAPFPFVPQEPRRVARDAYVAYRSNRYSVPWTAVGQEVWLRETGSQLEIHHAGKRLAVHPLCPGRHQVLTVPAHHAGIPFAPGEGMAAGKARIEIQVRAPQVEVRSLSVYDLLAEPPVVGGAR